LLLFLEKEENGTYYEIKEMYCMTDICKFDQLYAYVYAAYIYIMPGSALPSVGIGFCEAEQTLFASFSGKRRKWHYEIKETYRYAGLINYACMCCIYIYEQLSCKLAVAIDRGMRTSD
jgi:hypothetical protein